MERIWKIFCVNDREGKFPSNENYYIPFIGSYEEVKEYIRKLYTRWESVGCIEYTYECGEFEYNIPEELCLADNYLKNSVFDTELLQVKQFVHDNLGKEVCYTPINLKPNRTRKGIVIGYMQLNPNDGYVIVGSNTYQTDMLNICTTNLNFERILVSSPIVKWYDYVQLPYVYGLKDK